MKALLLAAVLAAGAKEPCLTISSDVQLTAGQSAAFREDVREGWRLVAGLVGSKQEPPPSREADGLGVFRFTAADSGRAPAECHWRPRRGHGHVRVFLPRYQGLPAEQRRRVIAHELMHLYYHAEDHYGFDAYGRALPQANNCVMGNFVVYGWSGWLCDDCRGRVGQ